MRHGLSLVTGLACRPAIGRYAARPCGVNKPDCDGWPQPHRAIVASRTRSHSCAHPAAPPTSLRPISLTPGFSRHAEGSCLIRMGNTEVLCAASVEGRVPPFLRNSGQGWVTAEYGMLPRATHTRGEREAARGKQSGRTQEIQRLIGRALRAVVDRSAMGEVTVTLDCDVLNADGGTRCAAITGAWVALSLAFRHLQRMNVIKTLPLIGQVAAVSCGIFGGEPVLDLDYAEDFLGRRGCQLRADRQPAASSRSRAPRNAARSPRHSSSACSASRARASRRCSRRSARRSARLMARRLAGGARLVLASHNPGKLAELTDLLRPHGVTVVSAGDARPAGTAGGRARLRRQRAHQGAGGGAGERSAGAGRQFRLLRRRAERRARCAFGALGRSRRRISPRRWRGCTARWATPRIAAPGSSPRCASPGRTGIPRPSSAASMARRSGRRAATRVSATIRCSCRPAATTTFGEMDPAEKHAVSHRARAFAQFMAACLGKGGS